MAAPAMKTLTPPVSLEAGLVQKTEHWPGIVVLPQQLGIKTWTTRRPDIFFDPDNPQWPAEATLQLTMPEHYLSDDEMRSRVALELKTLESATAARLQAEGRQVLGHAAILATSATDRAKSCETTGSLNPNFAVGRGQNSAYQRAVRALRNFRG